VIPLFNENEYLGSMYNPFKESIIMSVVLPTPRKRFLAKATKKGRTLVLGSFGTNSQKAFLQDFQELDFVPGAVN
jgi:hypothetical protein